MENKELAHIYNNKLIAYMVYMHNTHPNIIQNKSSPDRPPTECY